MRTIDSATSAIWLGGDYLGAQSPITRVTIQAIEGREVSFGTQVYFSIRWGQTAKPIEVPNIRTCDWERKVGTPVSQAKLTMWNARPLPLGQIPEWDLDERGYYTPDRGNNSLSPFWGDLPNPWQDILQEDRLIRIYQGYGWDATKVPELDPHMYLMFTGLVSEVVPDGNGLIAMTVDDLGRELNDEIAAPPVVPLKRYPSQILFSQRATSTTTTKSTASGDFWRPKYQTDSGVPYNGFNGEIYGHYPSYAFDGSTTSYWLSIGNAQPGADYAFEYVQGHTGGKTVNAVKTTVWGGPYKVYVSVKEGGIWQGKHTIPYNEDSSVAAPNGADIRFVTDTTVDREGTVEIHLPRDYAADSVRLTFTDLCNSHLGSFPYRAGVRDFHVAGTTAGTAPATKTTGNYQDYTDIVKLLLAYGGFYWPINNLSTDIYSDGSTHPMLPSSSDSVLQDWVSIGYTGAVGRIWGDLMNSGTFGPAPLDITIFDKKPLLDGINYIADMLNFLFTIDYNGGAIWRSPNIWQIGNYVDGAYSTGNVHHFSDQTVLTDINVTTASANKRERVLVASVDGKYGAVTDPTKWPGFGPNAKLRRTAIWTDTHFTTNKECQIMADLIAVRQLWTRRSDRIVIVGTPAVEIDDQCTIQEHTTNETNYHYIQGIQSSWSIIDGTWKMTLDTNWLGTAPFGSWMFNPANLDPQTQAYLRSIGMIP